MRWAIDERIDSSGELTLLRYTPWEDVPGLVQGVTVKDSSGGGVSWSRLQFAAGGLGFAGPVRLKQVHGRRVLNLDDPLDAAAFDGPERPAADGLAGSSSGVLGAISAADCVPAFLLDRSRKSWAAVHAGWRGVVAGVLPATVSVMAGEIKSAAGTLELYLGPSICGACYEVGPDMAARLSAAGRGTGIVTRNELIYADLLAILKFQALECGLKPESVAVSSYCTRCRNELFCSFRAEGERGLGRMWGVIGFAR